MLQATRPKAIPKTRFNPSCFTGKEYAKQRGNISVEQATAELSQQALSGMDAAWQTYLGPANNQQAQDFLNKAQGNFTNDGGQAQALFTNKAGDYTNGLVNAADIASNKDNLSFYQKYVQSGRQNDALSGTASLVGNQAKQLPGAVAEGVKAILTTNPVDTAKAIATGVYDSTVGAGTSLGAGAAAFADQSTKDMLTAIYGDKNASTLVGTVAVMPAAAMVAGAAVGAPAAVKGVNKAADATGKALDEALIKSGQNGLLDKVGAIDPQTGKPVLNLSELAKQPGGKTDLKEATGELFGNATAKQLLPEGKYLGGSNGTGKTGIDGVYQVDKPGVDYVFIENKFDKSTQGKLTSGDLQGSVNWLTGGNRIENAVGDNLAPHVRDAIDAGRFETWLVRTLPDGRTPIKVLDPAGKPMPIDQSKILTPGTNLNGVKP